MKRWFFIGAFFIASTLTAGMPYETKMAFKALLQGEKAKKLNSKVIQFYVSHPKTAEYLHQGGEVAASILEKYCAETEKLIEKYPHTQSTVLAEKRVANIRYFLGHKVPLTKAGLFLFLGVYSLDDYQDAKSWKKLLELQTMIANHLAQRAHLKGERENLQEGALQKMEYDLMAKIQRFCQQSADPFFHSTLLPYIKGCQTREDVLKLLAPLRDETEVIPGEVVSEAEEAYASLNQEIWDELKDGIDAFFSRPETLEQFIDITSDTFDIPRRN